jgi:hypothetical protein
LQARHHEHVPPARSTNLLRDRPAKQLVGEPLFVDCARARCHAPVRSTAASCVRQRPNCTVDPTRHLHLADDRAAVHHQAGLTHVGWRIVSRDPRHADDPSIKALFEQAWAAAPPGFLHEDTVAMLPRDKIVERCRLCGKTAPLTREHIPPRSSGNVRTGRSHTFDDWLDRTDIDVLPDGEHQQGGIFGYTLCADCNSFTGTHYGAEYQKWADLARDTLGKLPHPEQLDRLTEPLGWNFVAGSKENGGVLPGLFVRQVLSCFCSLSGTWHLAERHPELRRIILDRSIEPMPPGVELGLSLYYGPHGRMVGPTVQVDTDTGEWRWLMEIAFPPFAFILVIDSNVDDPGLGLMMTEWTNINLAEAKSFEGVAKVGFAWTPYPGDYRTRAAIAEERNK